MGPVVAFIDSILEADQPAPRNQRHTAHRIYVRLSQERSAWSSGRRGYQVKNEFRR